MVPYGFAHWSTQPIPIWDVKTGHEQLSPAYANAPTGQLVTLGCSTLVAYRESGTTDPRICMVTNIDFVLPPPVPGGLYRSASLLADL